MASKAELLKDLSRTMRRIMNKHHHLETMPIKLDAGRGLSHKEFHAIHVIGSNNESTVTSLADHFGITDSAASQMVSKLADKGYVNKEPSKHSKRELKLTLTDSGAVAFRAHEMFHNSHLEQVNKMLNTFTPDQIATILTMLDVMEGCLDEILTSE